VCSKRKGRWKKTKIGKGKLADIDPSGLEWGKRCWGSREAVGLGEEDDSQHTCGEKGKEGGLIASGPVESDFLKKACESRQYGRDDGEKDPEEGGGSIVHPRLELI